MAVPLCTLTWRVPAAQMRAGLLRLTTMLVQAPYTFLHTLHQAGYSAIDIYDAQHQLLTRVVFHLDEAPGACTLSEAPGPQDALPLAVAALVQALRQLWMPVTPHDLSP